MSVCIPFLCVNYFNHCCLQLFRLSTLVAQAVLAPRGVIDVQSKQCLYSCLPRLLGFLMAISILVTGGRVRGQGLAGLKKRLEETHSTLEVGQLIGGVDMGSMRTK